MRPAVAVTVPADSPPNDARQMGVFDLGKKPEERIWDRGKKLLLSDLPSENYCSDSSWNDAQQMGVFDIGKKQEERIWDRESLTSVRNRKNGSGTEAGNPCYATCRRSYCSDSPRNDA